MSNLVLTTVSNDYAQCRALTNSHQALSGTGLVGFYGNVRYFTRIRLDIPLKNEDNKPITKINSIQISFSDGLSAPYGFGIVEDTVSSKNENAIFNGKIKCFFSTNPDVYQSYTKITKPNDQVSYLVDYYTSGSSWSPRAKPSVTIDNGAGLQPGATYYLFVYADLEENERGYCYWGGQGYKTEFAINYQTELNAITGIQVEGNFFLYGEDEYLVSPIIKVTGESGANSAIEYRYRAWIEEDKKEFLGASLKSFSINDIRKYFPPSETWQYYHIGVSRYDGTEESEIFDYKNENLLRIPPKPDVSIRTLPKGESGWIDQGYEYDKYYDKNLYVVLQPTDTGYNKIKITSDTTQQISDFNISTGEFDASGFARGKTHNFNLQIGYNDWVLQEQVASLSLTRIYAIEMGSISYKFENTDYDKYKVYTQSQDTFQLIVNKPANINEDNLANYGLITTIWENKLNLSLWWGNKTSDGKNDISIPRVIKEAESNNSVWIVTPKCENLSTEILKNRKGYLTFKITNAFLNTIVATINLPLDFFEEQVKIESSSLTVPLKVDNVDYNETTLKESMQLEGVVSVTGYTSQMYGELRLQKSDSTSYVVIGKRFEFTNTGDSNTGTDKASYSNPVTFEKTWDNTDSVTDDAAKIIIGEINKTWGSNKAQESNELKGTLKLICFFEEEETEIELGKNILINSHYSPEITASVVSYDKDSGNLSIKYSILDFGSNNRDFDKWKIEILDENKDPLDILESQESLLTDNILSFSVEKPANVGDSFRIGIKLTTWLSTKYNNSLYFQTFKESKISYDTIHLEVPTIAYRPNQVGINHASPEDYSEALLVLGKTSNNDSIPRTQIVFDGKDDDSKILYCQLINFHIDCGEWTST